MDNGTNFTANTIPNLNKLMSIRAVLSAPCHPETNSTVERVNGTLVKILRKLVNEQSSRWSHMISSVNFAYNISVHSSTGHSPYEPIFGRKPALPPVLYQLLTEASTNNYTDYLSRLTDKIIKLQIEAFEKQ